MNDSNSLDALLAEGQELPFPSFSADGTCSMCWFRAAAKKAAKRSFRKLLKDLCYVPRVIVIGKLGSYGAAKRETLPGVEHRQSRHLNNRCKVSHQPSRRRERHMRWFKSARHAQQFLSGHTRIHHDFQLRRHRLSASEYRTAREYAFAMWRDATGTALVG
jgi:putative transposase